MSWIDEYEVAKTEAESTAGCIAPLTGFVVLLAFGLAMWFAPWNAPRAVRTWTFKTDGFKVPYLKTEPYCSPNDEASPAHYVHTDAHGTEYCWEGIWEPADKDVTGDQ